MGDVQVLQSVSGLHILWRQLHEAHRCDNCPGKPDENNYEKIIQWSDNLEDAFFRICSVLSHCNKNGIVYLLSQSTVFEWNNDLKAAFKNCKEKIIELIKYGVGSFENLPE